MKKLIFSLIAGAVLIGAGVGVLFMELTEFTTTDYLPYINEKKLESFTFSDSEIFSDDKKVEIDVYLGEYFEDYGSCEVIEDQSVEGIDVKIYYKGEKPVFSFYTDRYYKDSDYSSYTLYCYAETYMPKDLLDAAKYMFHNKVIVKDPSNYHIEKVVIRTSHPEMITTSY